MKADANFLSSELKEFRSYESQKSEQLLSLEPNGSRPMKPSLFIPGIL